MHRNSGTKKRRSYTVSEWIKYKEHRVNILPSECPERGQQFDQEETADDESDNLGGLEHGVDPRLVLGVCFTSDKRHEDFGENGGDIQADKGQDQVVLLLGGQIVLRVAAPLLDAGMGMTGVRVGVGMSRMRKKWLVVGHAAGIHRMSSGCAEKCQDA